MIFPRTFSHIGLSVNDLEKAVKFYTEVFGFYVIMPPTEITEDDSAIGIMCNDVFGKGWGSFKIAHLSTGDKIGIEIFEFPNAKDPENNFEYWKTGIFHFCIQDPDIESLVKKSLSMAVSSACRFESITPVRSHTEWCIVKTPSVISSNYTAIAMN